MVRHTIIEIPEPKIARFFFADTRAAWFWALVRISVGVTWLSAAIAKLNDPSWMGAQAGSSLRAFLADALIKTAGSHPGVLPWYGAFLQNTVLPNAILFSYLVVFAEFIIGLLLTLGVFTGICGFLGAFFTLNYLFAGSVGANPLILIGQILLVLAWRNAGFWGFDRFLLPEFGVPWKPGQAWVDS